MLIDRSMSKADYQSIHNGAIKKCLKQLYPTCTYNEAAEAKKRCLQEQSDAGITVTDYSAEIKLQSLLDHTKRRILHSTTINVPPNSMLVLLTKIGFDGSTGHWPVSL